MTGSVLELLRQLGEVFDRRSKRRLMLATIGSVVVAMLDTLGIALVLPLVNLASGEPTTAGVVGFISRLLGHPSKDALIVTLTASVVALFILKDVGQLFFSWWVTGFIFTERIEVSTGILRRILTAPYVEVSGRSTAEMMRTMDAAVMQVFNYAVNGVMFGFASIVSIVAIAVALAIVAPLATFVLVAYFGLAALLFVRIVKPHATSAGRVMTDASMHGWRTAFAALGGIKELHLRGTQEHFVGNYRSAALRGARAGQVASFLNGLPKYILEILFIVAVGLILLLSHVSSGGGVGGALGLLALFVAAGFRILPAISSLLGSLSNIRVGQRALDLVRAEILASRDLDKGRPREDGSDPLQGSIAVEDLHFRYPGSTEDVLSEIHLQVPRGTSLALVGGSGAGKTTLIDLMLGLFEPHKGRIAVGGVDIRDATQQWQRSIGYVPQDVFILDATLAENVAFDQPRDRIDEDRLQDAVKAAQLGDVVAALPEGVDTPLGEKGTRLSGGQRQRVGIARALYLRPSLLVLDEATSALDNETEHRITETINALHGEVTVLVVAHRLSTVRHCDQIAFLDRGHIAASGTFEELTRANADFARLVELGSLTSDHPLDRADAGELDLQQLLDQRDGVV